MRQAYDYWQDQPGSYRDRRRLDRQRLSGVGSVDPVASSSGPRPGGRTRPTRSVLRSRVVASFAVLLRPTSAARRPSCAAVWPPVRSPATFYRAPLGHSLRGRVGQDCRVRSVPVRVRIDRSGPALAPHRRSGIRPCPPVPDASHDHLASHGRATAYRSTTAGG